MGESSTRDQSYQKEPQPRFTSNLATKQDRINGVIRENEGDGLFLLTNLSENSSPDIEKFIRNKGKNMTANVQVINQDLISQALTSKEI